MTVCSFTKNKTTQQYSSEVHSTRTLPPHAHVFFLQPRGCCCLQIDVYPSTPFLCIYVIFYTNVNKLGRLLDFAFYINEILTLFYNMLSYCCFCSLNISWCLVSFSVNRSASFLNYVVFHNIDLICIYHCFGLVHFPFFFNHYKLLSLNI